MHWKTGNLYKEISMTLTNCKFFFLAIVNLASQEPNWYSRSLEGWYYFQEEDASRIDPTSPEEAAEVLEAEQRRLKEILSIAVLQPSRENIKIYIAESNRQTARSAQFADAWDRIELENND
jgi:F plasmid transfer operon protein